MTLHGYIENRIRATPQPISDFYFLLFQFLSSSYAASIGINLVALQTGSNGNGMGFANDSVTPGDNAFYVFQWSQAQVPFYVLFQYTLSQNVFGNAPGNPAKIFSGSNIWNPSNYGAIAVAVASRADKQSPWNGTTASNGNDRKGTPVWISGSSNLACWPRSNSLFGSTSLNRENMIGLVNADPAGPFTRSGALGNSNNNQGPQECRLHILADQDDLFMAWDIGNAGRYNMFYFGKYQPRPGLVPDIPYVCLSITSSLNYPVPFYLRQPPPPTNPFRFGNLQGIPDEGGVCHPSSSLGVRQCSLDVLRNFLLVSNFNPNTSFQFPPKFDLHAVALLLEEDPGMYGYLGNISFFHLANNIAPHTIDTLRGLASFGNNNVNSVKVVVPWDGATTEGAGGARQGRMF